MSRRIFALINVFYCDPSQDLKARVIEGAHLVCYEGSNASLCTGWWRW